MAIRQGKDWPFQMFREEDDSVLLVNVIGLDYFGTRWSKV
jgi:hypothetical protein